MKVIKLNDFNESNDNEYGTLTIYVEGDFKYKNMVVYDIRKILSNYIGKKRLFVDGKEINPHI